MRNIRLSIIAMAATITLTGTSWAADGAALFKTKCAACHGAQGEGKPAMKAPSLKDSKLSAEEMTALLEKGDPARKAPHLKPMSSLTPEDVKAVVEYVKSLK